MAWVKFWIRGRCEQVTYKFVDDHLLGGEEEMKSIVESWAEQTGIGKVADHYTYGWEEVNSLPKETFEQLKSTAEESLRYYKKYLKMLASTKVDE